MAFELDLDVLEDVLVEVDVVHEGDGELAFDLVPEDLPDLGAGLLLLLDVLVEVEFALGEEDLLRLADVLELEDLDVALELLESLLGDDGLPEEVLLEVLLGELEQVGG